MYNEEYVKRLDKVMNRIGGAIGILDLPEQVKDALRQCSNYETRVKMLEMIADALGK